MSIESLKEQARRHEQNEEWKKALESYNRALKELAREDQVDIGLYNRVGDLFVRVGDLASAIEHYESAVDLYREAYLPNNAIAVCKKIIRNVPTHHKAFLKIGQIRAEQGFLPDARTNFLTYAERMQQDGQLDESFRALIEFCDLSPDDVGVRITVAEQMAASGRAEDAVEQLLLARQHLARQGDSKQVDDIEKKVLAIDPDADLSAVPAIVDAFGGTPVADDDLLAGFADITLDDPTPEEPPEVPSDLRDAAEDFVRVGGSGMGGASSDPSSEFEITPASSAPGVGEEAAPEVAELPMMSFDDEPAAEEEAAELPMMELDEAEEEAPELPMISFDDEPEEAPELPVMELDEAEEEAPELPIIGFDDEPAEEVGDELPTIGITTVPDHVEPAVEEATDGAAAMREAMEEMAGALEPEPTVAPEPTASVPEPPTMPPPAAPPQQPAPPVAGTPEAPRAAPEPPPTAPGPPTPAPAAQPPSASPPAEGYVDLGAMILGGGADEKSTRLKVAYEEPTGDEEADFARMLTQFKEKLSENLDSSDVRAHYDLGTAYKEMGLLDEAISAFQAALRAAPDHLPTYELMGQTFIDMGQPEAAVKSLKRALMVNPGVEDELVGIYYYLARAHEALDDRASAVEFYDRVFSLDINFADVTERLRELR